jgi:hypothetical protein
MTDPTHLKKEKLVFAQEMSDAVLVLVKKSIHLLKVGEAHRESIEWETYEGELYERTKKFLEEEE